MQQYIFASKEGKKAYIEQISRELYILVDIETKKELGFAAYDITYNAEYEVFLIKDLVDYYPDHAFYIAYYIDFSGRIMGLCWTNITDTMYMIPETMTKEEYKNFKLTLAKEMDKILKERTTLHETNAQKMLHLYQTRKEKV